MNPDQIHHRLETLGLDWADKQAAFQALDDARHSVKSQCMAAVNEETSMAAKEAAALRSPVYLEHLETTANARRAMNEARVKYDCARVWAELLRSKMATERAQMELR